MTRISSAKYLAGSRGATCKLQIPDVCTGDVETTVPAHIRDRHTGRGQKASDLSVADACFACHEVFDRRAKMPDGEFITGPEWLHYALRGLQGTLESRQEAGLLFVPQDVAKPFSERPAKPRKPPEQRTKIAQRETVWPSGRKIPSRVKATTP
jgi:hypothetical protein